MRLTDFSESGGVLRSTSILTTEEHSGAEGAVPDPEMSKAAEAGLDTPPSSKKVIAVPNEYQAFPARQPPLYEEVTGIENPVFSMADKPEGADPEEKTSL